MDPAGPRVWRPKWKAQPPGLAPKWNPQASGLAPKVQSPATLLWGLTPVYGKFVI